MSENMKLAIDNGTRKIEVNDQGECIILPLGDQAFVSGLLELMKKFSESAEKVESAIDAAEEDTDSVLKAVDLNLNVCKEIASQTDSLFRDEVCRKVFGDIVPSLTTFAEFFDKLAPFVRAYGEERTSETKRRIAKYTQKYHKKE